MIYLFGCPFGLFWERGRRSGIKVHSILTGPYQECKRDPSNDLRNLCYFREINPFEKEFSRRDDPHSDRKSPMGSFEVGCKITSLVLKSVLSDSSQSKYPKSEGLCLSTTFTGLNQYVNHTYFTGLFLDTVLKRHTQ